MTDDLTKLPEGWKPATFTQAPTPWVAEKAYGDWNVYDSEEKTVAAIHVDDDQDRVARLIAAAPDLLAACVQAYGDLIEGREVDIEKLDAAIAKAEGR